MQVQTSKNKHILISYFDPFDGRQCNNSEHIAKSIEKYFNQSLINITLCPLETVHYKSSQKLISFYEKMDNKPDFVISLGEGKCDGVYFETMAHNYSDGKTCDNEGTFLKGKIVDDAKDSLDLSLNLEDIFNAFKDKSFIHISKSPGEYVCNSHSYLMAKNFLHKPFAFIHVPKSSCSQTHRALSILIDSIKYLE
ncbi:MAG: hypothetical protein N4A33_06290 [Bacteriovoracaceae bacterium]|jgi:pyrrolidone-carboxylate peptidase|nr:hypothetical protein [Bacteriovoracaceae bacterium]